MGYETIETSFTDGIFTIKMNRAERKNAMSPRMMVEISKALASASENEEVDYVILTGSGDYYSSGMDMKASFDEGAIPEDPLKIGREFVASFIDFPKLLIAIVNGPAIGIAFTTLGLCDMVYSSSKATFWAPFTAHGLNAEGCSSYIFPRIMGNVKATEILQFGKKLTANEAKECGLITDVYDNEDLNTVLLPKIHQIKSTLSKQSTIINKKLIRQWQLNTLHEVNNAEWKELEERIQSQDFMDAVAKFLGNKKRSNVKL